MSAETSASIYEVIKKGLSGETSLSAVRWRSVLLNASVASLVLGCLLAVMEPESSIGLPLLASVSLWTLHALFAAFIFLASVRALSYLRWPDPLSILIAVLTLPFALPFASLLIDHGFGADEISGSQPGQWASAYLSEVADLAPVSMIAAILLAFLVCREAVNQTAPAKTIRSDVDQSTRPLRTLLGDVPAKLGNDIVRLQAQDHYVEIVTTQGAAMLTKRFSDCVEALRGVEGMQCHRSHWICLRHAERIARSGSAYKCVLDNGDEVPVGRRRYAELKRRLSDRSA